jgi:hypothetical protein
MANGYGKEYRNDHDWKKPANPNKHDPEVIEQMASLARVKAEKRDAEAKALKEEMSKVK